MNINSWSGNPAPEDTAILSAVLATAVDAIIIIDHRGKILVANRAVEKLFGFTVDELAGQNVSCLMPPVDREQHDQYIRNYLRTGTAKIIGIGREVLCQRKDGNLFAADLAVSEIKIKGKHLFAGILRDMTDRRRAEAAIERERQFANNLLDTANALVLILDSQGLIYRVNHFFESLTGYSLHEVAGKNWFDNFIPEEHRQRAKAIFVQSGHDESVQIQSLPILLRDGRQRTIAWSGRRLTNVNEVLHGLLAIGNDITDLQTVEQKLIQQERLAAIGQVVTGLAHESRNALQRSRACLDMLELDCNESPDRLDLIHRTQQAIEELQRLYEEVRNYAAPIKLDRMEWDLLEICQDTWGLLNLQTDSKKLSLVVSEACPPLQCMCDRERMQQVFRNIFENAIAVAPLGSRVWVSGGASQDQETPTIYVSIRDEGPGLNAEKREKIFEPFYTTKTRGTGLGMAISRRIVESHGGQIAVGDPAVQGAEIKIWLPQKS